jgi:hypothetical protein
MNLAILSLGLWLAGAQGFAAQACCSEMPAPKQAACDGCGSGNDHDTSPRPDCCTSLEAQKDIDVAVPRQEIPQSPVLVELLTEDATFAAWKPESADVIADQAASRAEGPPLYLRNEVFLI